MPKAKRKNEASWSEAKKQWRIDVLRNGTRKSFYSSDPARRGKLEAERKADEWLMSSLESDMRFSALWEAFLGRSERVTGTGNYRNHESIGRLYLLPALGKKRVSAITQQHMQNIIDAAYEKGRSRKYLSNIRASLTALYTYARKSRIPMERPDMIEIPRDAPVGERQILQPTDLKKLFENDTYLWRDKPRPVFFIHAWRFLVLTGLRPGELFGLQHADVADGILRVRRAINTSREVTRGKNDNARRWFVIPEHAQRVLADQEAMLKRMGIISPWVFPDEHGDQADQMHAYRYWMKYREQYGIKSTMYEMRHTMISIVSADLPDKLLKSVVGHSEKMDTQGVYSHAVEGEAVRTREIIDAAFDRLLKQ